MPPVKQLAMKRQKSTKISQKQKMARMLAARHKKRETEESAEDGVPQPDFTSTTTPVQSPATIPSPASPQPSTSTSTPIQPPTTPIPSPASPQPSTSTSTPSQPPVSTEQSSASKRKLDLFNNSHSTQLTPVTPTQSQSLPTTITNLNNLKSLMSGQLCSECFSDNCVMQGDASKNQGMAIYLKVVCLDCNTICGETFSSSKTSHTFDVNRRLVSSSLASGIGYSSLAKFCELMNMPGVSQTAHHNHMEKIDQDFSAAINTILVDSAARVREAYGGEAQELLDIAVSFDGSWPKRGHTSRLGIGIVIDVKTGLALDFHVMSTYCQQCSATGDRLKKSDPQKFTEWSALHKSCTRNFCGTSGAMEVEAAKVLWGRSEALHGMRYTTLVSDGDTKTFAALQQLAPYDKTIEKQECINHVAKRLNTALRNLVSTEGKKGVRLGGSAKGSLTQAKMGLLQSYYTKAVRTYNTSVEEMSDAIWAGFYHSVSSDSNPQHDKCPKSKDSWCFYQRAIARGEVPIAHSDRVVKTYLNDKVASYVMPVYTRLTDPALLKRCLLGKTQNANESLHSAIWSKCPKHLFGGLKRVRIAVALGIAEFNGGSSAAHQLMAALGCPVSAESVLKGKGRDKRRVEKAEKALETSSKLRRQLRQAAQQKEREEEERREGGSSYIPGGF